MRETHKELRTIVKQHNKERMANKEGKKIRPKLDSAGMPIERKRDFVDIYLDKVMEGEKIGSNGIGNADILDEHGHCHT